MPSNRSSGTFFPNDPDIVLSVQELQVRFMSGKNSLTAVENISFDLRRGETLGIVGESGSGKSVTALSIPGLIDQPSGRITNGRILFRGEDGVITDLRHLKGKKLRQLRGNSISMIFQEPMSTLNPVFTCGVQIAGVLRAHRKTAEKEIRNMTLDLLGEVQLPQPGLVYDSYPHQLSGGQKQRVMIAMAMACQPSVLIADEPTTALDVTVQANILRLIEKLQEKYNTAVIFITHDLGVVAEVADRILVLEDGVAVEQGTVFEIFSNPRHPYTQGLIACRPRLDINLKRLPTISDFKKESAKGAGGASYRSVGEALLLNAELQTETIDKRLRPIQNAPILEVRDLRVYYAGSNTWMGTKRMPVRAVDGVEFKVYPGETIGLVGESGCGKTTLGRALIRLQDPTGGEILFDGRPVHAVKGRALKALRRNVQIIFQDPQATLNPRMTVGEAVAEPLKIYGIGAGNKMRKRSAIETMERVGLSELHYNRYPHEFSGGQRQRIAIARALVVKPRFIICDESVSALDVSVQAHVLNLLNDLKKEFNFTYMFISHDLSIVKFMADRIMVMKNGRLVEIGYSDALFERPKEAYTRKLINAIPKGDLNDIRKAQLRRRLISAKKSLLL
jgi:peptide/nickel transport system ATP-binding protein